MTDLFGELSSESEYSLRVDSEPQNPCNQLMMMEEFLDNPDTTVSRDIWIPGYCDRVRRSSLDTISWSARKIILMCISEFDLDTFFHHQNRGVTYSLFLLESSINQVIPHGRLD